MELPEYASFLLFARTALVQCGNLLDNIFTEYFVYCYLRISFKANLNRAATKLSHGL